MTIIPPDEPNPMKCTDPNCRDCHPPETQRCECCDPYCPVHPRDGQCRQPGTVAVRRCYGGSNEPTLHFCAACAKDALESGVFA